jgi:tetratricopeptide (TPR) repeat protein
VNIFGYQIDLVIAGFVVAVIAALIALFAWILPRRARLDKSTENKIKAIEKLLKTIANRSDIQIYVDGLPSASPPVFDPFAKGVKLMAEYKWDEAIVEFKKSMKEAKDSQLVALYNLIGVCYFTLDKLVLAEENYNNSLTLAREFSDKDGEVGALGNLGLIYHNRGDLDKALEYHEENLKIARESGINRSEAVALGNIGLIFMHRGDLNQSLKCHENALKINRVVGNRKDEALDLGNIGLIFQCKGDFDNALEYHEKALKINREISNRKDEGLDLFNIGSTFRKRGEKKKALKYFEDALKIFTEIGEQKGIEQTKENIKRLKGE